MKTSETSDLRTTKNIWIVSLIVGIVVLVYMLTRDAISWLSLGRALFAAIVSTVGLAYATFMAFARDGKDGRK